MFEIILCQILITLWAFKHEITHLSKIFYIFCSSKKKNTLQYQGISLKVPPCPIFGKKEGVPLAKIFIKGFLAKKISGASRRI